MQRQLLIAFLAGAGLLFSLTPVSAQTAKALPKSQARGSWKSLNLTPAQDKEVKAILKDSVEKIRALRSRSSSARSRDTAYAIRQIRDDTHARLSRVLSADQMARYDRMYNRTAPAPRARPSAKRRALV